MDITRHHITVKQLTDHYQDSQEAGVTAYGGNLDIRPPYQREFVYKTAQQQEVIHTITRNLPLNVMYWVDRGENHTPRYEVLDGQQRTLSICKYVDGSIIYDGKFYHNLTDDQKAVIDNYPLDIYICSGTDTEKLDWFTIVNIAGEQLTRQELRNAVYAGPWVTDAKRYFSKTGSPADTTAADYLKGSGIRQDYLETAITWAAHRDGITVEEYMARHQDDPTAHTLWSYFSSVIDWVKAVFPTYHKTMKGIAWGDMYNEHGHRTDLNPADNDQKVRALLVDEDVTAKKGIYDYILTGNERKLSIRSFGDRDRLAAYERQHHQCAHCHLEFDLADMQADHIMPWSKGGKTVAENCQMLCRDCNLNKSDL